MGCSMEYAAENEFYSDDTGEEAWFYGTISALSDLIIKYGAGEIVYALPDNIKEGLFNAIIEEIEDAATGGCSGS